jgi:hypothetical protein
MRGAACLRGEGSNGPFATLLGRDFITYVSHVFIGKRRG